MKVTLPKSAWHRYDSRIGINLPNTHFEIKYDLKAELDSTMSHLDESGQKKFLHIDIWSTRYGFRKLLEYLLGHSEEGHHIIQGLAREIITEEEPDWETEYKSDPTIEREE